MTSRARIPSGTEPATARTAPRLRMVLAAAALVFFSAWAWVFLGAADGDKAVTAGTAAGIVCILIALSAAVDLVILARRIGRGDYRGN